MDRAGSGHLAGERRAHGHDEDEEKRGSATLRKGNLGNVYVSRGFSESAVCWIQKWREGERNGTNWERS